MGECPMTTTATIIIFIVLALLAGFSAGRLYEKG